MADEKKTENKEQKAAEPQQENPAELKEKFLRLAAEFDNYKKRTKKDLDEAGIIGRANLAKELLPVIDEFQLALLALDKSADKDMNKGIMMLYANFMDTLKRNGLSEVNCDGRFDPFRHEVVMMQESKEKEGTILEVLKKGYEFNGRMIRPASVIVAKPIEQKRNDEKKN